jgi:hypothetical protein
MALMLSKFVAEGRRFDDPAMNLLALSKRKFSTISVLVLYYAKPSNYLLRPTYSTTQQLKAPNSSKCLGITNTSYKFSFLSLLSKKPTYVVLPSNLEVSSTSFLHVRALYLVLL